MIVVIGCPAYRAAEGAARDEAVGLSAGVARASAAAGSAVELVGKIGDDAAGDALVLALAADGVGHAALLRDPAHGTPLAARSGDLDDGDETMLATEEPETGDGLVPADRGDRPALDADDLSLALRYLADYRVIVVAESVDAPAANVVAEAAAFAGSYLVVIAPPSAPVAAAFAAATVFEAPVADPDGAFATVVGRYAAALDQGSEPADAFERAVTSEGWQAVEA